MKLTSKNIAYWLTSELVSRYQINIETGRKSFAVAIYKELAKRKQLHLLS